MRHKSWDTFSASAGRHAIKCGGKSTGSSRRVKYKGQENLKANCASFVTGLKACAQQKDLYEVGRIHSKLRNSGLLQKNACLGNTLVSVYAKCGALTKAKKVLYGLPVRNVVTWNALIAGYVQHGCGKEALGSFYWMRSEGLSPNAITYSSILKACGLLQDLHMGVRIHDEIASQGLLEKDVVLGGALIDMYAKSGALLKAQALLDEHPLRDVVTWSALIAGYAQHGWGKEALGCFHRMRREGLSPNAITYACTLKACGLIQDLHMGEKIHDEIASQGLLGKNVVLGSALIDMYAKCGAFMKANQVLNGQTVRNVITWNTLIAGYAQHGCCKEALGCFNQMQSEGFLPDEISWNALIGAYAQQGLAEEALNCFLGMQHEGAFPTAVTFISLLNACSHSGLVEVGEMLFDSMRENYGILPDKEHYTCMVDLLGRARHFDKAMRVIKLMPSSDYLPVWSVLLGACRKWGNMELGKLAFARTRELDQSNASLFVKERHFCSY